MHKGILSGLALAMMSGVCFAAEGSGNGGGGDRGSAIKSALTMLDTDNDEHWTNGGLPNIEFMKQLTGFPDLSRAEVGKTVPGFSRQNANVAPSDGGNLGPSDVSENAAPSPGQKNTSALPGDPYLPEKAPPEPEDKADAIGLLEAAMAAATNPVYRQNGALMQFVLLWSQQQLAVKSHQKRIEDRQKIRDDAAKRAAS